MVRAKYALIIAVEPVILGHIDGLKTCITLWIKDTRVSRAFPFPYACYPCRCTVISLSINHSSTR